MGRSCSGTASRGSLIAAYKMQQRRYRRGRRVVFYCIRSIPGFLEYDGIIILWPDVLQCVLSGDGGLGGNVGCRCEKNEAAVFAILTSGMGLYCTAIGSGSR